MTTAAQENQKVPIHRNPWFYGAVIGLAFVTLIRPWTRHEPDPAPILGTVEEFTLHDKNRAPFQFTAGELPRLISLAPSDCAPPCDAYLSELKRVHEGLESWKQEVGLITIAIDAPTNGAEEETRNIPEWGLPWTVLQTPGGQDSQLVASMLFQHHPETPPETDEAALGLQQAVLVDQHNQIRGYFTLTREGLNEAFHRAVQVRMEE